jgi:putative transposase
LTVAETCRILDVSRTAFYAWKTSQPTASEEHDDELAPLTRVIFRKHRRRYVARRIIEDLKKLGHVCSRRKVSGTMKKLHLKVIHPQSFVPKTTASRRRLGYSPNLFL